MSPLQKLSDMADVSLGQTFRARAESETTSGIRLIQIKDIREGEFRDVSSLPYAAIESSKLKVKLMSGDLLLPLRGTRAEAMIFNGVTPEEEVTTTNQVAIIKPNSSRLVSLEYLHWFFNSSLGKVALESIRTTATIPNISVKNLSEIKLPIPSIEDQKDVVAIYLNWAKQKVVLHQMLLNGEKVSASAAEKILRRG